MDKNLWQQVESIVDTALNLPATSRTDYINQKCSGDPELYSSVTELLQSIEASEGYLEEPDLMQSDLLAAFSREMTGKDDTSSMIGQQIGSYKITELLGYGGMGSVFLAERVGDFEHKVALKLIRRGMDTPGNIARFERERGILAALNHPNIGKIYDGGITPEGLPYLVMEYIDGIPIDEYCRENKLTIEERLELFKSVCGAVQHAHSNLVIHRDLKPGNILVDAVGKVHILDFGIAKMLDEEPSGETIYQTQPGAQLLTLGYAAPEQLDDTPVTTATDIYALGVLLHVVLTGRHPFDFEDKSITEIKEIIKHRSPSKPSAQGGKWSRLLKEDLDAIILKALRKQAGMRYNSAGELLEDLNRYEQGLPVAAHDDSFKYYASKFIQRHKKALSTAAVFLLLLTGFTIFYTYQITEERNLARYEADKAAQVQDFLVGLFQATNPDLHQYSGKEMPAVALLDQGIAKIERELAGRPAIQAEILISIHEAYENLEQYDAAEQVLDKIEEIVLAHYGAGHIRHAAVISHRSTLSRLLGDLSRALDLNEQAASIYREQTGTSSIQYGDIIAQKGLIYAHSGKFQEAQLYYMQADSIYRSLNPPGARRIGQINNISNLAEVLVKLGRYEEAKDYQLTAIDQYEMVYEGSHINIARSYSKLGTVDGNMGDFQGAIGHFKTALEIFDELLPPNSRDAATTYNKLGLAYWQIGELAKAKEYCEQSYHIHMEKLGPNHEKTLAPLNNLALIHKRGGELEEARRIYQEIIRRKKQMDVVNEPSLAISLYNLADLLHETGELKQAYSLYQQVIAIDTTHYGANHPTVALDLNKMGAVERDLGLLEEAEQTLMKAGNIFDTRYPENHLRIADYNVERALLEVAKTNFETASDYIDAAMDLYLRNQLKKDDTRIQRASALQVKIRRELEI